MLNKIKDIINRTENSRVKGTLFVMVVLFSILISRVFYLQIIKGNEISNDHTKRLERKIYLNGPRGNIYDRNGKLLAYNKIQKVLAIDINLLIDLTNSNNLNDKLNETIINTLDILYKNSEKIKLKSVPISIDDNGNYQYNISDKVLLFGFLRDIFSKTSIDKLTPEEKNISAETLVNEVCFTTSKDSKFKNLPHFNIDKNLDKSMVIDIFNIRNEIYQHRYQEYKDIIISSSIGNQTVVDIEESKSKILGIKIIDKLERVYNDGKYFANIIGYTGSNKDHPDIIEGKMGIESSMNETLVAKNGEKTIYVDSTGKILDEVNMIPTQAGKDITLSIDSDLQKFAYDTIEDSLTKYYLERLEDSNFFLNDVRDVKDYYITSYMIYNSLLTNGVINLSSLSRNDATVNEKNLNQILKSYTDSYLNALKGIFKSDKPVKDFSRLEQKLIKYIFTYLQKEEIILANELNPDNETIKSWLEKKLSVKAYISFLLGNRYLDLDKFEIFVQYSDINNIIDEIMDYINVHMENDKGFLSIYSQEILASGNLNPRLIIDVMYDQQFLSKDEDYKKFEDGMNTYAYLRHLIENKKLTPGIIGVDPFSASMVINDVHTGKVLAMVSYPSYDNNKMDDQKYLRYLLTNSSSQLINRPTQLMKPPGSTFKPITSIAGLNESVIEPSYSVNCEGEFTKVTPHPKCWVYPKGHGKLNLVGAITNSCNVYFNDVGFKLGFIGRDRFSSAVSIETLNKYATMYGLSEKCGLEIEEYEPHLTDDNGILSAIGQGSYLFNASNLSRYISAIANDGNVIGLSVVQSVNDENNNPVQFPTKIINKVELDSNITNIAKVGMREVVQLEYNAYAFKNLPVNVAGKTGTAQEDLRKNPHSLFISYSPYEKPEIATSIIFPNMQSTTYHIETTSKILEKYYNGKEQ